MNAQVSKIGPDMATVEQALVLGNIAQLTPEQRVAYVHKLCEQLGLNPLFKPFEYMSLQGKLTLYATKGCAEQLRQLRRVSITLSDARVVGDVYLVSARAKTPDGREDESMGAVAIKGLVGEALANAYMRCECVPLEYEALTRDGFKNALDLSIGEPVAAMDPQTQEIHWVPLEAVSTYENKTVTRFKNAIVEFEITSGHSWVTETSDGVRSLKPYEQIKGGTKLILAGINKDTESVLTEKEAATLGWIITDGTVRSYRGKFYRAAICQSKKENFDHINWALSEIGSVTKGVTDGRERGWMDQHWWYLSKDQTTKLFEKAGYFSVENIPEIVSKLGFSERAAMLDAMMRADGTKNGAFGKSKPEVIETFQILCALNGYLTSKTRIREFPRSTKPFYETRRLSCRHTFYQNMEEQESRQTTVWCPTTRLGTWICRTDRGQVMVTGNTKAKRRVTLSICGLNMLDESEVDTVAGATKAHSAGHTTPADETDPAPRQAWSPSEKQLKRLFAIGTASGWSANEMKAFSIERFNADSSTKLTREQYEAFCHHLAENPKHDAAEPTGGFESYGESEVRGK